MKVRLALCLLICYSMVAQKTTVSEGTRVKDGQYWFPGGLVVSSAEVNVAGSSIETISGKPYSLDEVCDYTTLDGTTSTSETATLYRDSEGRTRADVRLTVDNSSMPKLSTFSEIIDPIAGFRYLIDPGNNTATRTVWPPVIPKPPDHHPGNVAPAASEKHPSNTISVSSLGEQFIEGVLTHGQRTAITYLAATDKAVTVTSENWKSPDLKIILLSKSSDPRNGESSVKTSNLNRSEPDASLFRVPEGFTVIEK